MRLRPLPSLRIIHGLYAALICLCETRRYSVIRRSYLVKREAQDRRSKTTSLPARYEIRFTRNKHLSNFSNCHE